MTKDTFSTETTRPHQPRSPAMEAAAFPATVARRFTTERANAKEVAEAFAMFQTAAAPTPPVDAVPGEPESHWCALEHGGVFCRHCDLDATPTAPQAVGELVAHWHHLNAPMLALGQTYTTRGGERVTMMEIANAGKEYESMVDQHGRHRYSRSHERIIGRCTCSANDDPGNIDFPIPAAPVAPRAGEEVAKYDDVLVPFLAMMRAELHANADKGDRPGWLTMDRDTAMLEVYHHAAKLAKALRNDNVPMICEHAADVANMAMMVVDVCGALIYATPPAPAKGEEPPTAWISPGELGKLRAGNAAFVTPGGGDGDVPLYGA